MERIRNLYHTVLIPFTFILTVLFMGLQRISERAFFFLVLTVSVPLFLEAVFCRALFSFRKGRLAFGSRMIPVLAVIAFHIGTGIGILRGDLQAAYIIKLLYYDVFILDLFFISRMERNILEHGSRIVFDVIALSSLYGLIQYAGYLIGIQSFRENGIRIYSIYSNPIPFGNICLIGFWMCELIPKAKVKLLLRVILAVNIILTYSRSAWLGLFLSVLFYGILNRKQVAAILKKYDPWKISFICFGGIAVVLLLIILSGRAEDFLQRFRFDMKNEAFNIRLTYARAFLQYLLQGPPILKVLFGHGVATSGAFIQTVPEYMSFKNGFYQYFDNSYITMVYEFGIVPALIFVCFIVSLIRKVLKRHRGTPYLLAFIASAVAFFFYDARIYVDVTFPAIVCVFLGLTGSGENHG